MERRMTCHLSVSQERRATGRPLAYWETPGRAQSPGRHPAEMVAGHWSNAPEAGTSRCLQHGEPSCRGLYAEHWTEQGTS